MTLYMLSPLDHVRFWSKVSTGDIDACWPWRGGTGEAGHGQFSLHGRNVIASRIAYQLGLGEIPDGLLVRHRCDNPPCCNPRHLETGTTQDNTMDRNVRGRTNRGAGVWHKVRLTEADVLLIRATPQAEWTSLAKELGVSRNTVYSAATGQSWKHLPGAVTELKHGGVPKLLQADDVAHIRTSGLSDSHLAKLLGVGSYVVRNARIGISWADHPIPPDTRRRESGGMRHRPAEARFRSPPKPPGDA